MPASHLRLLEFVQPAALVLLRREEAQALQLAALRAYLGQRGQRLRLGQNGPAWCSTYCEQLAVHACTIKDPRLMRRACSMCPAARCRLFCALHTAPAVHLWELSTWQLPACAHLKVNSWRCPLKLYSATSTVPTTGTSCGGSAGSSGSCTSCADACCPRCCRLMVSSSSTCEGRGAATSSTAYSSRLHACQPPKEAGANGRKKLLRLFSALSQAGALQLTLFIARAKSVLTSAMSCDVSIRRSLRRLVLSVCARMRLTWGW
jgi:hypothetical protein